MVTLFVADEAVSLKQNTKFDFKDALTEDHKSEWFYFYSKLNTRCKWAQFVDIQFNKEGTVAVKRESLFRIVTETIVIDDVLR